MGVGAIIGLVISAAAGITSAAIRGGASSEQNRLARQEARALARQQRADTLKQRASENNLRVRQARLGEQQLASQQKDLLLATKDVQDQQLKLEKEEKKRVLRGIGENIISKKGSTLFPKSAQRLGI